MGRHDLPPPSRTQRRQRGRRVATAGTIFVILTTILLCYTRSLPEFHLLLQQPTPNDANADERPAAAAAPMAEELLTPDHPSINHPTLVSSLPPSALPQPGGGPDSPHLIIIGDVHGQLTALDALLKKAGYSAERGDTVVFTGDMINKGPDSPGVIDRAIAIGAYGVRGNHEDKVLRAWAKKKRKDKNKHKNKHNKHKHQPSHSKAEVEEADSDDVKANREVAEEVERREEEITDEENTDDAEAEPLSKTELADYATAAHLTPKQLTWLAKLPVILRLGTVSPRYGDVVVVHAGLVPGVPLEKQDARAVMNMRTLLSLTSASASTSGSPSLLNLNHPPRFEPSEGRDGQPWAHVWNELEKEKRAKREKNRKAEEGGGGGGGDDLPTTVVYGHDAKTGLAVRRYAFGLDSSCVRGGDLTALVFEPAGAATSTPPAVDSNGDDYSGGGEEEEEASMAKHGIAHRLVSVSCEAAVSDDDGKGGKKKKDKKKDK
ncbi:hypothetical protein Hte_012167 [Hypoxylon texense]